MDELLNSSIEDIVSIFNDELNVMLNQLILIANNLNMSNNERTTIINSKNKLCNAINVNVNLCVELYAKFLLTEKFNGFFDNIKARNYKYFYELTEKEEIDPQFRELMVLIRTVSYQVGDETKNDVFGYVENLSLLATIFAQKKIEKK